MTAFVRITAMVWAWCLLSAMPAAVASMPSPRKGRVRSASARRSSCAKTAVVYWLTATCLTALTLNKYVLIQEIKAFSNECLSYYYTFAGHMLRPESIRLQHRLPQCLQRDHSTETGQWT